MENPGGEQQHNAYALDVLKSSDLEISRISREKVKLDVRTLWQRIRTGELKARGMGRSYLVTERRMLEYVEGSGGPR
jgi:hypothetical protein